MTDTFVSPNGAVLTPHDTEAYYEEDQEDQLYTIIGYDPGGTTGWAVLGIFPEAIEDEDYLIQENIAFWSIGEISDRNENKHARELLELARAWSGAKIVGEQFILRKFLSSSELLSPVRVNAKFEYALEEAMPGRQIIWQQAELAMSTITDLRLQKMGLYAPTIGKEHGRDGLRHALTWAKRARQMRLSNKVATALLNGSSQSGGDAEAAPKQRQSPE